MVLRDIEYKIGRLIEMVKQLRLENAEHSDNIRKLRTELIKLNLELAESRAVALQSDGNRDKIYGAGNGLLTSFEDNKLAIEAQAPHQLKREIAGYVQEIDGCIQRLEKDW
jgi:hypothetical protein